MNAYFILIPSLFLSVILLVLFIKESYIREKFLTIRISFCAAIILVLVASTFFTEQIEFKYYLYATPILDALIGCLMYLSVNRSNREKKIKAEYFSCVEMNNYFMYLDKKNRIIDISKSFLSFLNVTPSDAYKEDFSILLTRRFSNFDINGIEYNQSNVEHIFDNIKTSNKELNLNITCLNLKGNEVKLNLIDRPVLSSKNKFLGHIIYGVSKDSNLIEKTEQDLNIKSTQLEMNKRRFRILLEETQEPIFFVNLDTNSIWANDSFVSQLGFESNGFTKEEFYSRIHPDDLNYYNEKINNLTMSNPRYEIKYRFKKNYDYVYVYEHGKKLYGPQTEIVSVMEEIKANLKSVTGEALLDRILDKSELLLALNKISTTSFYFLVDFKFTNIEKINKEYDRKFGDICMNQYLLAIRKAFVDNDLLFRVDGLEFVFVITDTRKMNKFKSMLESGKLTSNVGDFSGKTVCVETIFGVTNNQRTKDFNVLVKNVESALTIAERDPHKKYYLYE